MNGYVYLLTDGEYFKIGVTRGKIEKRIKKLQTGNPYIIAILKYFYSEYPFQLEKYLHNIYEHKRVNNEWFNLDIEDVKKFDEECKKIEDNFNAMKDNPFFNKNINKNQINK